MEEFITDERTGLRYELVGDSETCDISESTRSAWMPSY